MQNYLNLASAFLAAHQVFATAVLWPVLTAIIGYLLKKGPALGAVVHALGTNPDALVAAIASFLQKAPPAAAPLPASVAPSASPAPAPQPAPAPAPPAAQPSPVVAAAEAAVAAGISSLEAAK